MNEKKKDAGNSSPPFPGMIPDRYSRNLGTIGKNGQERLSASEVIVAGLGGLGGYVVEILARLGIGTIVGIDCDSFEESNLNRQLFADKESLGRRKATVAKEKILLINDRVNFIAVDDRIESVKDDLYAGTHLIFDCLDNAASRIFLQSKAKVHGIPLVHGSVGGWYAQVALVLPGCDLLSKMYGDFPDSAGLEHELGTPSFIPPVAAGIMVCEGVKVLLGRNQGGSFLVFLDLLNNEFEHLTF